MRVCLSFDVERDLHTNGTDSLEKGLPVLLEILEKKKIKCTFFAPAVFISENSSYFKKLKKKGHEIALHGYLHERFDSLPYKEKERRIKKSLAVYKKIFKVNPRGFRAPQLSIDNETIDLLSKNKFSYDSSHTPLNFFQLVFFPKKIFTWINGFFKPLKAYEIRKGLSEVPISSFVVPFTSLTLRILPRSLIQYYLKLLSLTNKDLMFLAHSWDLIEVPQSRINRTFSSARFIRNLEYSIELLSKSSSFVKAEELTGKVNSKSLSKQI